MKIVSHAAIDLAWQKVVADVLEGKNQELLDNLSLAQPKLMSLLLEAAPELQGDAADLLFHSALVIWHSFFTARQGKVSVVSEERLLEYLEKTQKWINHFEGDAVLLQKKITDTSRSAQPNLMSYVFESVFEANEDGLEIEPHDQRILLILLTTIVEAFS